MDTSLWQWAWNHMSSYNYGYKNKIKKEKKKRKWLQTRLAFGNHLKLNVYFTSYRKMSAKLNAYV